MRVCHFIIPKQGDYTGLPPNEQAFESHSEVVKRGLAGSHGTKYIFYLCLFSFVYCIIFVFCICLTVEGLRARFGGVGGAASATIGRQQLVTMASKGGIPYNGQDLCNYASLLLRWRNSHIGYWPPSEGTMWMGIGIL